MRIAVIFWSSTATKDPVEQQRELLPPATEKALTVPRAPHTYTIRPPRPPSRALATLRKILRKAFRKPLLWAGFFLEGYKLTALAAAAFCLAFVCVLFAPSPYGPSAWWVVAHNSAVFGVVLLVAGLINGAVQGMWEQGLFGWLHEYWKQALIVQAVLTFYLTAIACLQPRTAFSTSPSIAAPCKRFSGLVCRGEWLRWFGGPWV
jgi:hypothetical protein